MAKTDEELIRGGWKTVSVEDNGRKRDRYGVFEFHKGKMTATLGDEKTKKERKIEWTFVLDPSKNPKAIDFKDDKERTCLGIYQLMGDTLKICMNEKFVGTPGADRPTEFKSEPQSANDLLIILNRLPKK